jgi:predicted DNA-binding protein with PD1-like motif
MRAHVLEVPAGRDVLSCVAAFARRVRRGALVLGAAGRVVDAVLCRVPAPLVLRGTAEILGMAGCFFPNAASPAGVAVFLAGPRGGVLGGGVAEGGLVAAGPVVVMVATFVAATFDRLPLVKGDESGKADGCAVVGPWRCAGLPLQQQSGWSPLCRKLGANS